MQITDKLMKPLTEVKYLNADNVSRYRCIMRIFFDNYEKLRYWLYQEDVFEELKKDPHFEDYRMEQCQQDLAMLTEWKNLNTIQDTRKVASIEEFKNKKFRYQMSEYSVEIERLVVRLENLFVEGASLEPTLLERIRRHVERFPAMAEKDTGEVYTWWMDLNNDFVRLNQNYQDYIRDLNSVKAEKMMQLISICYLVVKGLLQTNSDGSARLMEFVDEQRMCRLYEKFILEYYRKEYPDITANASQIAWQLDDGIGAMLPIMQTDIMLTYKEKVLIIDAKYYMHTTQSKFDRHTLHSGNLYQIFTYVKNKEIELATQPHEVSGMLLYAKTDETIYPNNTYQMSGNKISVKTLDLNLDFDSIVAQLNGIVKEYFGL